MTGLTIVPRQAAVPVHATFAEYVPFAPLLRAMAALRGTPAPALPP